MPDSLSYRMAPQPDWVGLEMAIESLLHSQGQSPQRTLLLDRITRYAALAVHAARASAIAVPDSKRSNQALIWLRKPVFICGHHRSGTTLLQQLLDGHPALVVLPSEGTYFTSFRYVARTRPSPMDEERFIADWIARFVDPNYAPHFKLGRSTAAVCPSVCFARAVVAWRRALSAAQPTLGALTHFAALAAAYREVAAPSVVPSCWVEKTPLNENYVHRFKALPDARFIHVIRDPKATLASMLARLRSLGDAAPSAAMYARSIGKSMRRARTHGRWQRVPYLVVRYEDLVGCGEATMARVCEFLDIDMHPALRGPTVGGSGVAPNSSFAARSHDGAITPAKCGVLTPSERALIDAMTASVSPHFGYECTAVPWMARCRFGARQLLGRAARKLIRQR